MDFSHVLDVDHAGTPGIEMDTMQAGPTRDLEFSEEDAPWADEIAELELELERLRSQAMHEDMNLGAWSTTVVNGGVDVKLSYASLDLPSKHLLALQRRC